MRGERAVLVVALVFAAANFAYGDVGFSGKPYYIYTQEGAGGWYYGYTTGTVTGLTEGHDYIILPRTGYNVDYANIEGAPAWEPWAFTASRADEISGKTFYISVQVSDQGGGWFYVDVYRDTNGNGQIDSGEQKLDTAWVYVDMDP